ncbi:hypothetical protein GCM10028805_46580 [Spirosoma harenae]
MDTQTQAQIYLADLRGRSQIDYLQSFHSFNFGQYTAEGRQPFGSLQLLNDDWLKAGHSVCMQVEQHTEVIILPIVGGLEYKSDAGTGFLEAGQAGILSLTSAMKYELINPYETESINYLVIWQINPSPDFCSGTQTISFDLQLKNQLLPLFESRANGLSSGPSFHGFIGRYDGRQEGIYPLSTIPNSLQTSGVYVFVLNGVFEVQNRLLHERDGLALTDVQHGEIEFEALSNDALLLLLEIPLRI